MQAGKSGWHGICRSEKYYAYPWPAASWLQYHESQGDGDIVLERLRASLWVGLVDVAGDDHLLLLSLK
jgi:hypothetical protein